MSIASKYATYISIFYRNLDTLLENIYWTMNGKHIIFPTILDLKVSFYDEIEVELVVFLDEPEEVID